MSSMFQEVPGHGIQITPNMINIKKEEKGATNMLARALPNFPQSRTATCLGQYSAIMERCKLGFELLATRIGKVTNPLSVDSQHQWNHEHSHDKASATASLWGIRQISHEKIGSYTHARCKPVSRIAVAKPNNELKSRDRENYRQLCTVRSWKQVTQTQNITESPNHKMSVSSFIQSTNSAPRNTSIFLRTTLLTAGRFVRSVPTVSLNTTLGGLMAEWNNQTLTHWYNKAQCLPALRQNKTLNQTLSFTAKYLFFPAEHQASSLLR